MSNVEEMKKIQTNLRNQVLSTDKLSEIKLIGGLDISFLEDSSDTNDSLNAVGSLSILTYPDLKLIHECLLPTKLNQEYIPGFLGFRECSVMIDLLNILKSTKPELVPQLMFVDGNGTLHPERFGSACHFGVLSGIPTIGIAKNFMNIPVDNLTLSSIKRQCEIKLTNAGSWFPIIGENTGYIYGACVRAVEGSKTPIFVSIGHKISLETAVKITVSTCKYRIPEPIRKADISSRSELKKITK